MVPVLFVTSEVEAELARGRLANAGITAEVRFTAQSGEPAYAAGYGGLGAPLQTYEVLVPDERAQEARALLRLPDDEPRRRSWWRIVVTVIVLIAFVGPLLYSAWTGLRVLF